MESLGYILVYFFKGGKIFTSSKVNGVLRKLTLNDYMNKKMELIPEKEFPDLPLEIIEFLNYIRVLPYENPPDFTYLKNLFKLSLKKTKFDKYDWVYL